MSTRMFSRKRFKGAIGAATDVVIGGISLPSDCVLNGVRLDVSLWGKTLLTMDEVVMYACEGWIIPVPNPEDAATFDLLWDSLVPKDTDVQTMDLVTDTVDSTPFFEPGEPDWSQLLDVGLRPERIYSRSRLLTPANGGSILTVQDSVTPFLPSWVPGDSFRINVKKGHRVRQPSVAVFAVASPALDDTTPTLQPSLAENEWHRVKYIDHVLEYAMSQLFGLTEAGAETPWIDAADLLQKYLEPNPYEGSAGDFAAQAYEIAVDSIYDVSVPGTMAKSNITTGR